MNTVISAQPRKQRNFRRNAPLHKRQKMMGCLLSKELRNEYNRRTIPVRKKDIVKVMRGEFKDKIGEVMRVDPDKYKIYVDQVTSAKADGTKVESAIDPSNVMVTNLFLEDEKRRKVLGRKISATEDE